MGRILDLVGAVVLAVLAFIMLVCILAGWLVFEG